MAMDAMEVDGDVDIKDLPDINKTNKADMTRQLETARIPIPQGRMGAERIRGLLSLSLLGLLNETGAANGERLTSAENYWKMQATQLMDLCAERGREASSDKKCILVYWLIQRDGNNPDAGGDESSNGGSDGGDCEYGRSGRGGSDSRKQKKNDSGSPESPDAEQEDDSETQKQGGQGEEHGDGSQKQAAGDGGKRNPKGAKSSLPSANEKDDQSRRAKRGRFNEVLKAGAPEVDYGARMRVEFENLVARQAIERETLRLRMREEDQRTAYEKQREIEDGEKRGRVEATIQMISTSAGKIVKMAREQAASHDQSQLARQGNQGQAWQREYEVFVQKQKKIRRHAREQQQPSREEDEVLQQDLRESRIELQKYPKDRQDAERKAREAIDNALLQLERSSKEIKDAEQDTQRHIDDIYAELNQTRKEMQSHNSTMVKELAEEQARFASRCQSLQDQSREANLPFEGLQAGEFEEELTKLANGTADLAKEFP